jgi:hypothetical protein
MGIEFLARIQAHKGNAHFGLVRKHFARDTVGFELNQFL